MLRQTSGTSRARFLLRIFSTLRARGIALFCAALVPSAAAAEHATFDVYLLGLRAGTLSYAMREEAGRYAVTGKIRSTGVIGRVTDFKMEAASQGAIRDGAYRPERYTETSTENGKTTNRDIRYDTRGTPDLTSKEKPRAYWIPPAEQTGTMDPMTLVYELMRDRTGASPCGLNATYGDGARMGRITSQSHSESTDAVTCTGLYERRGGFSPKQLKDGTTFPFTLRYRKAGDIWELTKLDMQSIHGRASLVRR